MRIRELTCKLNLCWCSCREKEINLNSEGKYLTRWGANQLIVTNVPCDKQSYCYIGNYNRPSYKLTPELLSAISLLQIRGGPNIIKFLEAWGHDHKCTK